MRLSMSRVSHSDQSKEHSLFISSKVRKSIDQINTRSLVYLEAMISSPLKRIQVNAHAPPLHFKNLYILTITMECCLRALT